MVSDHQDDGFGYSLSTSYKKLVIGALWDNNGRGSVMVVDGVRINAPQGMFFGGCVDVNQQFIVVSGQRPQCTCTKRTPPTISKHCFQWMVR